MPAPFLTLLRWPLWIAAVGTGAKSFADNPLLGSRRLNRWGLHRLRVRAAGAMTRWRRGRLAAGLSREDRAAFERQGYVEWPNVLPADAFERMRDAILGQAWPARDMAQGHTITRRIHVDPAMLRAAPDLAALLRHPRWRGLLRYVAGSKAEPLYYIQTILTHHEGLTHHQDFPHDGGTGAAADAYDPQNDIHADAFHPSMKAWLFLTDVALEDGPLTYAAGSHRLTPQRLAWEHERALAAPGLDPLSARGSFRLTPDELAAMGLPQPTPFAVPANTLVVADTFGFHARGHATRPSVRVELWAYARRNPFLPWTGLHLGSLPGLAHRRADILWWLRARLTRFGGLVIPPTTPKRPDDR
ncbi:phytanoyl-CoA dioxygenase family protein [Sphingobium sufflavum]|uniref:phytanoyl-CoA dioxygenase family protein n=1 Tax=Sphingobium sufflavum TaxID=1129547 RepID=UPI001F39F4B4|nr:phytanoyl-CoA dioxygenase family protein [Sphingobium sufflavum]MCE7796829.1 phytanoyl-CoA dioxygenase family protein [Sphingobium sufflavum]